LKIEDFNTKGSPTSSRDFVSFLNGMLDFEKFKNVRLKIRNIDETFLREYFKFLIDKRELGKGYKTRGGLNGRTIKKRFDVLKTYLKWLKEKKRVDRYTEISELISTGIFDRKSPVVKKLTLSVEQLKIISEYPIEDEKSPLFKVRDMFLFCCSTGLRFSDLIKINRTNITEGGNGLFFLNGIAVKTDTPFNIELSNRTYEIFERNNFTLNLMSNQKANLYLKKLLEQIDEFQKFSSKYDYKDEQGQTHHYRLFELVSFHTARRSFITTLLDNRYSINEIMTRTGHSKPSTLEKYINPNETLGRTIIDIFDY
jgi:integrase